MIATLAVFLLLLVAALVAMSLWLRLGPLRRVSTALPVAAVVMALAAVVGYALLAQACIREGCIADAVTISAARC
jgi:hypothetical protein